LYLPTGPRRGRDELGLVPRSGEQAEGSPRQTSMTDFYHSKRRLIFSK
nr:cyclin kinase inhibitor - human (fragments) [Homo sapiens]